MPPLPSPPAAVAIRVPSTSELDRDTSNARDRMVTSTWSSSTYAPHITSAAVEPSLRRNSAEAIDAPLLRNNFETAPLLRSSIEARWAEEMVAEGIGHLPVSWYRQTPKQALLCRYGVINNIAFSLLNFGMGVGLGYAMLHLKDEVGLWRKPIPGKDPLQSAAWADLYLTTFFICFFTVVFCTPDIRSAMKKGKVLPVDARLMQGGWWRCLPVRILGTCSRSTLLTLWVGVFVCTPWLVGMEVACAVHALHGTGSLCRMDKVSYIFMKSVFSLVISWVMYPIMLLMTLSTHTLPPLDLTLFAQNQKERWEKEQRERAAESRRSAPDPESGRIQ